MNFEQFHLPGFLLRDLYKESLIELNEIKQTPEKPVDLKSNVLGNNQQQVLILVNYPGQLVISEPDLSFLLTILQACNMSLNDVSIFNTAADKVNYQEFKDIFKPKVMLLFGVPQSGINLPVHFPDYQVQAFRDIKFLSSPPLNELQEDKAIKLKLWAGLKKIFLS
jgi:hypothetical protein